MIQVIEPAQGGVSIIRERNIPNPAYDLSQWVVHPETGKDVFIIGMSIQYAEDHEQIIYDVSTSEGEVSTVAEEDIASYYPMDTE